MQTSTARRAVREGGVRRPEVGRRLRASALHDGVAMRDALDPRGGRITVTNLIFFDDILPWLLLYRVSR